MPRFGVLATVFLAHAPLFAQDVAAPAAITADANTTPNSPLQGVVPPSDPTPGKAVKPALSLFLQPILPTVPIPTPGERVTGAFELYNAGSEPQFISSRVVPWTIGAKGLELDIPNDDTAVPFIQINPVQFALAPGQTMRVRYTIAAPANLDAEKRAAFLFQTRAVPARDANNKPVMISARLVGLLFTAPASFFATRKVRDPILNVQVTQADPTAPNPALKARIKELTPLDNGARARVIVENTSRLHIEPKGRIEALDAAGNVVAVAPVSAVVLPGTTRSLSATFDKPLAAGEYSIRAALDYGGTTRAGAQTKWTVTVVQTPANTAATETPAQTSALQGATP